jgi:endonuclease YncB( thermonuclease family)
MKITRTLLIFFVFCCAAPAQGMVLRALVSEVHDGKTLTVTIGTNRKLTVVLAGVDVPEIKQEYSEAARQHLASLVLNKDVEVEFTEMRVTNVVGKVYCKRIDVGLQVIRDGVAWYDPANDHDLTELECRLYGEAQQLARNEQRGLWHDGTPMPPWEWRRAQAAKNAAASAPAPVKRTRALSSEDVASAKLSAAPAKNISSAKSKPSATSTRLAPKPPAGALNKPGDDLDFNSYLNNGRVSIVYFYADWCPTCRGLTPVMAAIHSRVPDMQVLFMNIGAWNTPITYRYNITYVPYLRIYDKNGYLIAEGHEANRWLQQAFAGGGK